MRKPPEIDNIAILKDKIKLLDALKELEVANKYINLSLFQVRFIQIYLISTERKRKCQSY